jgi:hypothetical protein
MTMPAKHGLWLDEKNDATPMTKDTREEHHEPALVRLEARPRGRSRGDDELLEQKRVPPRRTRCGIPEGVGLPRVVCDELLTRPERVSTSPTRTDVGRVVVRTAECSRRTAPRLQPIERAPSAPDGLS